MNLKMAGVSQFIPTMTDHELLLYRGFDKMLGEGPTRNPYLDTPRAPKHSNMFVHNLADEWFLQRFGVAARSSTVICSTSPQQAAQYVGPLGCLAIISPIADHRLIYSPNVIDFLEYFTDGVTADRSSVRQWLEEQCYQCVTSPRLISREHKGEVMLSCEMFNLQHTSLTRQPDA